MGNSTSSSGRAHHDETVDFGFLTIQGVCTGPRDWNQAVVTQLIIDRKLAPFYRPLEDYSENWDDDQILAARKELPESESGHPEAATARVDPREVPKPAHSHTKRPGSLKEPSRCPEAAIYRGAVECPICFLYYPPNINHSRCCDQAICTECFVQIKRADPTPQHLVSEPAACPYCVQENFGVVYTPPSWRAGIGSEGMQPPTWSDSLKANNAEALASARTRRRKSFGADSPEVVTIDQIRPDWEAKLAAVRATVARRANRRIIMRQVGDRLIPVGVTSGRVHPLAPEDGQEGQEGAERGSRRSRRQRQQNQDLNQYIGSMGLAGQDLEELMIMEAMRLSLLEHEEQQRREAEEKKKQKQKQNSGGNAEGEPLHGQSSTSTDPSNESVPSTNPPISSQASVGPSFDANASLDQESRRRKVGTENRWVRSRSVTPIPSERNSDSAAPTSSDSDGQQSTGPLPQASSSPALPPLPSEDGVLSSGDASQVTMSTHQNGNETESLSIVTCLPAPTADDYISSGAKQPSRLGETPGAESFVSSLFTPGASGQLLGGSDYNFLPSSPDITTDDEPLLNHSAPTPSMSGDPVASRSN